jgi:hypothetical protein
MIPLLYLRVANQIKKLTATNPTAPYTTIFFVESEICGNNEAPGTTIAGSTAERSLKFA